MAPAVGTAFAHMRAGRTEAVHIEIALRIETARHIARGHTAMRMAVTVARKGWSADIPGMRERECLFQAGCRSHHRNAHRRHSDARSYCNTLARQPRERML